VTLATGDTRADTCLPAHCRDSGGFERIRRVSREPHDNITLGKYARTNQTHGLLIITTRRALRIQLYCFNTTRHAHGRRQWISNEITNGGERRRRRRRRRRK